MVSLLAKVTETEFGCGSEVGVSLPSGLGVAGGETVAEGEGVELSMTVTDGTAVDVWLAVGIGDPLSPLPGDGIVVFDAGDAVSITC